MATATLQKRLRLLEDELDFRHWLRRQRWFLSLTLAELADSDSGGNLHYPGFEPPPGSSPLDKLDRKSLKKLWQEESRMLAGDTEELKHYALHGHWPESCTDTCKLSQSSTQTTSYQEPSGFYVTRKRSSL